MPFRIAQKKVVLHRNGVRVTIKSGQKFDFTAEEIKDLKDQDPEALRTMVDESEDAPMATVPTGAEKGKAKVEATPAKAQAAAAKTAVAGPKHSDDHGKPSTPATEEL